MLALIGEPMPRQMWTQAEPVRGEIVGLRVHGSSIVCALVLAGAAHQIDGITFGSDQTLYAPIRELATALGSKVGFEGPYATVAGKPIRDEHRLITGERLMPVRNLKILGAKLAWNPSAKAVIASMGDHSITVVRGRKHTIVDKDRLILKAYQGRRLVLLAHVGIGREGHRTPNGDFKAGPKERMHKSRLYHFFPMPWSVPIKRDIFIHGFDAEAKIPPSHGCIRLAVGGPNPARWFYEWVSAGSEVTVRGKWGR